MLCSEDWEIGAAGQSHKGGPPVWDLRSCGFSSDWGGWIFLRSQEGVGDMQTIAKAVTVDDITQT